MRCQTRSARFAIFLLMVLGGAVLASPLGLAHQSDVTLETQAGSHGMVMTGIRGRWGFRQTSPWYVRGELGRTTVSDFEPSLQSFRLGGELGREDRRFSYALRYLISNHTAHWLMQRSVGGSLRVRFLPWEELSIEERTDLSREEKISLQRQREQQTREAVPAAPILFIDIDSLALENTRGTPQSLTGQQATVHFMIRLKSWVVFVPGIFAFAYSEDPSHPTRASIYSLPSLRMVTIGPQGPLSGVFGAPRSAQQLLLNFNVTPQFGAQLAFTRVNVAAPDAVQNSYWLGFERRLGFDQRWAVNAGFEHIRGEPAPAGTFTVRLRRELSAPYVIR